MSATLSVEDTNKIKKAIETCENLQAMIDISANSLYSLRDSLQSNPSSQASQQALRETEEKLVKMFSRQLVSKSAIAQITKEPVLAQYPKTEEWLRVVGLPSTAIKGLVAENVTLDRLLKMTPEHISDVMKCIGAHQSGTNMLNKALGKLKAWTESLMTGTEPTIGSPHSQRTNAAHLPLTTSRLASTSSVPRSSTSSTSSEQQAIFGSMSYNYGSQSGTLASQHSSSSGHGSCSAVSSPHMWTGPSRSPLISQHPSTPTLHKGKSRAGTPPPQRRNVINSPVFVFPASIQPAPSSGSSTPGAKPSNNSHIIKSISHDSTLITTHKPTAKNNFTQSVSADDTVEVSSIHSSNSNFHAPHIKPTHRIQHRFETKTFKFGRCDYCKRQITLIARVCRHCRYKCHKDCERETSMYSCGLPDDLVIEVSKIMGDNPMQTYQDSPSMGSRNGSLQGAYRRHRGSASIQDSSSASDYSSSPSSPLYNLNSAQASPANLNKFTFPQVPNIHSSRSHMTPAQIDESRNLMVKEREYLTSTVSTIDSQDTMTASRGTVELNVDSRKSEGSDQTVIDSNSSERTLPEHLEISFKGDDVHTPMYRQPSLSKALEEWIIPYNELIFEEEIGTGHVGTVYKGQWHGPVAIKKIPINPSVDRNAQIQAFKQEIATLKKTRHDNVVLFMGACMKPLAIVTSLVNGDTLYKDTRTSSRLSLAKVTNIASQIIQGMAYLHSKDIIHKHLTSKNIFVERGEKVVITDFGLQNVTRTHSSRSDIMRIPDGWLNYLSPEVIKALRISDTNELTVQLPFSKLSDIYAFGTVWYELLCGEWPHSSSWAPEIIIWQVGRGMKPSFHRISNATKEAKDILMSCWMYSTQDRPSFSMLNNMLERVPKKRLMRSPSYPIQLSRSIDSFFKLMD